MNAQSVRREAGARMRIRAFPMNMDEGYVKSTWELLRNAIKMIQSQNNSVLSFEELYRNAYSLVLHKHGDKLYNGLREVVIEHMVNKVRVDILESVHNNFLQVLNKAWLDHTTSMVMIRDILMYMDRVYVQQHSVDSVYNLGLILFRDEVIRHNGIRERLTDVLLKMVASKRQGDTVELISLKTACHMLMALGVNSRTVYEEDFETPFLLQSAEYFQVESITYLNERNAAYYVSMVNTRIKEESYLAKHYMDSHTEVQLIRVLEAEMISKHMHKIVEMENSGLVFMLKNNRYDDIRILYKLLLRVEGGLDVIMTTLSNYLRDQGRSRVQELKGDGSVTPVKFIQNLVDLKNACDQFLFKAFDNDNAINKVIASDFEYFLNLEPRTAEYLSIFIDDRLRRGSKEMNEMDLESTIDKAMVLFRFVQDKDIFERYYKQHLGKRLLNNRSVSEDAEKAVIQKLRTECGCQFTNKIEGMLRDLQLSSTFMSSLREYMDLAKSPFDISISVLTCGFWPTTNPSPDCVIPRIAQAAFDNIRRRYLNQHNGRSLKLQPHLGTVDLTATFYPNRRIVDGQECLGTPQKHILSISTYQMCVLMLFNEKHSLTYKEMAAETRIVEKDLKRILMSLSPAKSKQRVLCHFPAPDTPPGEIGDEDTFCVNDKFSSRLHRVKIQAIAPKADIEPEHREMRSKIDDQRRLEVEAAIVRIMKARKTLRHDSLIAEVAGQLRTRFLAQPSLIKSRIESLIDRDYLNRDTTDHKVYNYVA